MIFIDKNSKPGRILTCPVFLSQKHFKYLIVLSVIFYATGFSQGPGDAVFKGKQIFDFYLEFDKDNYLDLLYQSHKDKEYIYADVNINGMYYDSIGVRFKGTSSFYGYPGDKKSLRIKFDKYKEHRFDGLKKINLNNGWSDPTLLREKLYLDFLYEQNIPAQRANFARVYLNGKYHGFYTMVEHVDKTFLQDRFNNNDGNLFKAEKQANLTWQGENQENYYENYALKTNEKTNKWNDLVYFIDKLNNSSDDEFAKDFENVFNVKSYIKSLAANNLFINLDSYLGSANNYYLYNNEQFNRFDFIIWDVNLAFGARTSKDTLNIFYYPQNRPLIKRLLKNETYKKDYLEAMQTHLNNGFNPDILIPKIDSLFSFIKEDYFTDSLKMFSNDQITNSFTESLGNIPALKPFINNRYDDVVIQLASNITFLNNDAVYSELYPGNFILKQNYPNPFNSQTTIKFYLPTSEFVLLEIYNISGKHIKTLYNQVLFNGWHQVTWDGSNNSGAPAASGFYFYRIRGKDNFNMVRKMLLLQ